MASELRVLLLELDAARGERVLGALAVTEHRCSAVRVATESEFARHAGEAFDVVIAGRGAGHFDALSASQALARAKRSLPLIVVAGAGEAAAAAELVREHGASDFVRDDDLERLGFAVDVALERHGAREALRRAEEELARYRRFFVAGPVVVFRWAAREGWPVEYVSPNVVQIFGVTDIDFISGRVPYAVTVHPEDLQRVADEVRGWSEKGVPGFDQSYRIVRPGGEVRWLFDHTLIRRDAAGAITHYEGYVLDDTERRSAQIAQEEMQRQLFQTQKLESLGVLAGGIAHDFNNLLTGVLGYAGLALQDVDRTHPARGSIVKVIQATERAADLTRQMLAYAGGCALEKRVIDVSADVREIGQLLHASIPKKVRIHFDLGRDLPAVEADPAQIQQVVMNLVINAAEACAGGSGNVWIKTEAVEVGESSTSPSGADFDLAPGRWVAIEVKDDGQGMDEATRARISEPFFTTKFQGRGLGLSVVFGILQAHGGHLQVVSAPGKGSTFRVYLAASGRVAHAPPPEIHGSLDGRGLVLVIDDEPSVLQIASLILRTHGYEVLTAADGQKGLEMYRARRDEIDLVLLDLTMPGMSGEEVLRAMRAIDPDVAVIVASGYGENDVRSRFEARPPATFLHKPYSVEGLAAAVKRILTDRKPR